MSHRRRDGQAPSRRPWLTSKLSKGWCNNGNIVCGYHGWEYDRDGKLVMIPQFPFEQPVPEARARSFRTKARYGDAWYWSPDEPLSDIPAMPEDPTPVIAGSTSSTASGTPRRCG